MRKAACICLAIPFLFSSFLGIGFSQSDPAAGILPLSTQMVSTYDTVDLNSSVVSNK
jgi:hypothetical protein